jgi:hypothetical protein
MPYIRQWKKTYLKLNESEKKKLIDALSDNNLKHIQNSFDNTSSKRIKRLLKYHLMAPNIVKKYKIVDKNKNDK